MARRRVSDAELVSWFAFTPTSRPVRAAARRPGLQAVAETATR
jgi:hypothetical protein